MEPHWPLSGRVGFAINTQGRNAGGKNGRDLARNLHGQNRPALVSSPLGRVRQTAGIISDHLNLPVTFDARLAEVNIGEWNGHTYAEIVSHWGQHLIGVTGDDRHFHSPTGESYDAVRDRVSTWLGDQRGDTIAVMHGISGKLLRGAYAGLNCAETLALPEPQDAVFRLADGQVGLLP